MSTTRQDLSRVTAEVIDAIYRDDSDVLRVTIYHPNANRLDWIVEHTTSVSSADGPMTSGTDRSLFVPELLSAVAVVDPDDFDDIVVWATPVRAALSRAMKMPGAR